MNPVKIVVRDIYAGSQNLREIFAEIAEIQIALKNVWARESKDDTINVPTVKSKSVLFVSGGNNATRI